MRTLTKTELTLYDRVLKANNQGVLAGRVIDFKRDYSGLNTAQEKAFDRLISEEVIIDCPYTAKYGTGYAVAGSVLLVAVANEIDIDAYRVGKARALSHYNQACDRLDKAVSFKLAYYGSKS